jgi:hypothetical protein
MAAEVKNPYYKVKTPYLVNFTIPYSCVVCGNPPAPGLEWKVEGNKSSWNGKSRTTLSLKFPICQECYKVSRDKKLASFLTILGVLLAIGQCLLLPSVLNSGLFKDPALGFAASWMVFIILLFLVRWLGDAVNQKGFTPEQRELRKRVKRCARILSFNSPSRSEMNGAILFRFENPAFASKFSISNSGLLESTKTG